MGPTDSYKIRDATLGDAEAIARVSAESWRASYRGILPDDVLAAIDVAIRTAKRQAILQRGDGLHVVALDGDELFGLCDAGPIAMVLRVPARSTRCICSIA